MTWAAVITLALMAGHQARVALDRRSFEVPIERVLHAGFGLWLGACALALWRLYL